MNDALLAGIARVLAKALRRRAHDRDPQSTLEVAQIQTDLCAAVRQEERDEQQQAETPAT